MKQFLLLLKSSDFIKDGSTWVTSPINLYANESYTNYSYKRGSYGLDLVGDTTFVGMETTSPSVSEVDSTPYFENSIYVTDYGEVVYDMATPSLKRFVDLSSRIDIISFRHSFVNYSSEYPPNFSIDFFQSDTGDVTSGYEVDQDPQWMRAPASSEIGTVFIRSAKKYLRIKLDIDPNGSDISSLGLIFYLEVGIHEPSIPVLSPSVKSILERFPSWTAVYEDSVESATPRMDLPSSVAGKFFNALLQNYLDKISREIQINDLNTYISSINENMLAWVYVTKNVLPNTVKVYGDGIELARAGSYADFFDSRSTDHIYYYDPTNRTLTVMRQYNQFTVDGSLVSQEPVSIQNEFDEFGARVSLPRLYLESNANYKKRILDYSQNRPSNNIESFKKTLRRELDIWRAYGSTPDSDYLGATPDVLEISDIQSSSPYFESSGIPTDTFRKLISKINETYPSNMGYVRWEEGSWDYGGTAGEGLSRIPAVYDDLASPLGSYYKPGVGDLNDAKLEIDTDKNIFNHSDGTSETVSFEGYIEIDGTFEDTPSSYYPAVEIPYTWYLTYERVIPDVEANTVSAEVVYEVDLDQHGDSATPATFYFNFNEDEFTKAILTNVNGSSHSSSPEFTYVRIFENTGFTSSYLSFKNSLTDEVFMLDSATPSRAIHISDISEIRVKTGQTWNQSSQSYTSGITTNDYKVRLTDGSGWTNASSSNSITVSNVESATPYDYNLNLGSNKYQTKTETINSDIFNSTLFLNNSNSLDSSSKTVKRINISEFVDPIIYPSDATVKNIVVEVPVNYELISYDGEFRTVSGGFASASELDTTSPGVEILIPSSPSIIYKTYDSSDVELDSGTIKYLDSATIDYEAAMVSYIEVETSDSSLYPFENKEYTDFSASSTPNVFSGYIDRFNNTYVQGELAEHQYFNEDKFLEEYIVSKSDFSLSSSTDYQVERIKFVSSSDKIRVYTEDVVAAVDGINSSFLDNNSATVKVYAEKKLDSSNPYKVKMHPGWIYYDEDEYFIYANPKTETFNGQFYDIDLEQTPAKGAPVLVNVDGVEYREVFFSDSATPTAHSFENTEIVKGSFDNTLYVSYEDIFDASIKDVSTGQTLFSNLSSSGNDLSPFSDATPVVLGRNYEVTYSVNNSYFVDKDIYDDSLDSYGSKVYFSSTPSSAVDYVVTYEADDNLGFAGVELDIDNLDNPLQDGFIYVSNSDYSFSRTKEILSPGYIRDNSDDLMNLSILSFDVNSNVKGGQTFRIYGDNISSTPEYVTTNDNGYGKALIRYSGSIPAATPSDTLYIEGIGSSTPNGGSSSESQGYLKSIPFNVYTAARFGLKIKAVTVSKNISADGESDIVIAGQVYWNDSPLQSVVSLTVKVGESLYSTVEGSSLATIQTSSDGSFEISGLVTANDRDNPGIRFAAIEFEDIADVEQILTDMGEVLSSSDITISGEVVYWNEVYDNITYAGEGISIPRGFSPKYVEESQLYITPAFRYLHSTMDSVVSTGATPNWEPPKWFPISRYVQYQMGLLGSTPDTVINYNNMHPDHEED